MTLVCHRYNKVSSYLIGFGRVKMGEAGGKNERSGKTTGLLYSYGRREECIAMYNGNYALLTSLGSIYALRCSRMGS